MNNNENQYAEFIPMIVIADDFTGASDSGVKFCKQGLKTDLVLDPEYEGNADVLVFSTDSRSKTPLEAYNSVSDVLKMNPNCEIFKKIDSTMRGHIGKELEAQLQKDKTDAIFLCPALPSKGRIVQDGVCFVDGIPLNETSLASDPLNPMNESNVTEIIRQQASLKSISVLSQNSVEHLEESRKNGVKIFSFNAKNDNDLRKIIDLGKKVSFNVSYCGSSGLAGALAESLERKEKPHRQKRMTQPILFLSGSLHPTTLKQIEVLEQQTGHRSFSIPSFQSRLDVIVDQLHNEGIAVLNTFSLGQERGDPHKTLLPLAEIVKEIVRKKEVALVTIGGETTQMISTSLEAKSFELLDEIEAGIPIGQLVLKINKVIPMVTKSGGFGDSLTLFRIYNYLRAGSQ